VKRQVENVLIVIVKEIGEEDLQVIYLQNKDIFAGIVKHHLVKNHIKNIRLLKLANYALY